MSARHWMETIHALLSSFNQSTAGGCAQCGAVNKGPFQKNWNGVFRKMLCPIHVCVSTKRNTFLNNVFILINEWNTT